MTETAKDRYAKHVKNLCRSEGFTQVANKGGIAQFVVNIFLEEEVPFRLSRIY